ncbi:unnamed protein product [Linum trigynum]|uniref:Cytochrome P450 n=1 Tax=Linum trigynum TaxID=586398 RepID=A0AAV2DU46_9ROSI
MAGAYSAYGIHKGSDAGKGGSFQAQDKLPFTGKAFRMPFGRSSLFFCPYEQAKQRRETLELELNGKLLGRVVNYMMDRLDKGMRSGIVDCRMFSQHAAFFYLGTLLFGDAFVTWPKATCYEELLMEIAKDASFWASHTIKPFWKKEFWRFQSLCTELKTLTGELMQQCRKNDKIYYGSGQMCYGKTASFSKKDGIFSPRDFLQDQLSLLEIDSHRYSAEELCGNIMGIMFHGCLSMAGLISAVLERLATNPKIQHKVYTQITMLRQVSAKESHGAVNMPLLLATIYESSRVLATGLVLQICSLKDDLDLKSGVTIPAGAVLMVPVQLLHMEKSNWGSDAEKFKPYRFLSKSRESSNLMQESFVPETTEEVNATEGPLILNDPTNNLAFLPFGSGVCACACQKPVITGVGAMLASLLASYEVRASPLGLTKMVCSSFVGFIPNSTLL